VRHYIRHPADIPIEITTTEDGNKTSEPLSNISPGGVAFRSKTKLDIGTSLNIRIDLVNPPFETRARVVWCQPKAPYYEVGAELLDKEAVFQARMVEQICHIEHYRKEVQRAEGRSLSGREAALEWIEKYADRFPSLDD